MMSEHTEQVAVFQWAKYNECNYPELALLFAVPNASKRIRSQAGRLKAEGMKRGIPDIWLPVARGGYHGLVIEHKFGRNKATQEQGWWLERLREQGYKAVIVYGAADIIQLLVDYLEGKIKKEGDE
jgi:hypothetical protein